MAGITYHKGFIGDMVFSTLVLMGVFTTFLTAMLLKVVAGRDDHSIYRTGGQM